MSRRARRRPVGWRQSPPRRPARDLAQLGVCVFLALLGVVVLVDAATLGNNRTGVDPLGPRAVPLVLGSA